VRKFLGRGLWVQLVVLLCGLFLVAAPAQAGFTSDFTSSVRYDYEGMVAAFQGLHGNGYSPVSEEEQAEFAHIKFKIALGDYDAWSYCEELNGKPVQRAVKVVKPGYRAAGLQVGDALSEEQLAQLDLQMQGMNLPQGWYQADTKTYGKYLWLFNGPGPGGAMVPVKGFGFHLEDGRIKDIFWCVYLAE
jgi:hypothetical protein